MSDPIWALASSFAAAGASKAISTTSTASTTSTTGTSRTSSTKSKDESNGLDKDAFMKLLLTQMQSQDPLSPMDGQAFFTQLSQLSLLEQMYQLNDTLSGSQRQQQLVQASSMIGRQIEATTSDGSQVNGTVSGASITDDQVVLDVNGEQVPLSNVTSVHT